MVNHEYWLIGVKRTKKVDVLRSGIAKSKREFEKTYINDGMVRVFKRHYDALIIAKSERWIK